MANVEELRFTFHGDERGKLVALESLRLDWPDRGLLIEGLVWREMRDFFKRCGFSGACERAL